MFRPLRSATPGLQVGLLIVVLSILSLAPALFAQVDPNTDVAPKAFGSYSESDISRVNLTNGALEVNIPIISYPQRGGRLSFDISLRYHNEGFWGDQYCDVDTGCSLSGSGAWSHGFTDVESKSAGVAAQRVACAPNQIYCDTVNVQTNDGGVHPMMAISSTLYRAIDNSGYLAEVNWFNSSVPNKVWDNNGTLYTYYIDANQNWHYVQQDTNGNTIEFANNQWSDTVGRTIPNAHTVPNNTRCSETNLTVESEWDLSGVDNASYPVSFCYITVAEMVPDWHGESTGETVAWRSSSSVELHSIVLPNGQKWVFEYTDDGYGDLKSITNPIGGTVNYWWADPGVITRSHTYQIVRSISQLEFDPGHGQEKTNKTFSYQRGGCNSSCYDLTTTETEGPSSTTIKATTEHHFQTDFYESSTIIHNGSISGAVVKSIANTFVNPNSQYIYPLLTSVSTTVGSATSRRDISYAQTFTFNSAMVQCGANGCLPFGGGGTTNYGLKTAETVYGFSNETLSGKTFNYQAFTSSNTNYLSKNLLSLMSSVSESVAPGQTITYGYDEAITPKAPCSTGQSNPSGVFGNQTSVSSGGYTSGTLYNQWGLPVQKIDARGKPTCIQYGSSGDAMFPSSTKNALGHETLYNYDSVLGQLKSVTDPNGRTTSYSYLLSNSQPEPMGRLKSISYADGGNLAIAYNDNSSGASITAVKLASPNPSQQATTYVDGFGRTFETQQSGASTNIYTYQQRDYGGRIKRSWNPTSCDPAPNPDTPCSTENTWGYMRYEYDALGRVTDRYDQDGTSNVHTAYGTSSTSLYTDTSDESSHTTRHVSDALGRLTDVYEDPAGLNLHTNYTYDGLGNLKTVTQSGASEGARTRTFSYDSLSRLLWSHNPETGVICYGHGDGTEGGCQADGYDENGNLLYKTDARKITVNYSYDALNRLVSKTYSSDFTNKPSSCYQYDTSSIGYPNANLVGRLTNEWTQGGGCDPANLMSVAKTRRSIRSYDAMGRARTEERCVLANCSTSTNPFALHFDYDLAGNLTEYDNGIRNLTLSNVYDGAGRMNKMTSTAYDLTHPNTLYDVNSFLPNGIPNNFDLGLHLNAAQNVDNRLRPTALNVTVK